MGGTKNRARTKKATRDALKSDQRKSIEKSLSSPASDTHQPGPHRASNKKCPHVKSGIKLKKLNAWTSRSPVSCSSLSCASNNSLLWLCLYCMSMVCDSDVFVHEHAIHVHIPPSSVRSPLLPSDLESAISSGTLRFFCSLCNVDLCTTRNTHLLDALSVIKKRLGTSAVPEPKSSDGSSTEVVTANVPTPASNRRPKSMTLKPNHGAYGIRNLGNTCYAASLLQCLTHARHLAVPTADDLADMDALSFEFYIFIKSMQSHNGPKSMNPAGILTELGRRFNEFRNFRRQNDSHEMLRCLFDAMDSEHAKRNEESDQAAIGVGYEPSIVAKAFRSEILSCIQCMCCNESQVVTEVFFDLPLIVSSTLTSSIAQFFSEDVVSYTCENTNCPSHQSPIVPHSPELSDITSEGDAMDLDINLIHGTSLPSPEHSPLQTMEPDRDTRDNLSIDLQNEFKVMDLNLSFELQTPIELKPPQVPTQSLPSAHIKRYVIKSLANTLCLQLKRTMRSKKVRVDFPLYFENDGTLPNNSSHYELFAMVEHSGSMNFGHYTAYVKVHQPLIDVQDRGTERAFASRNDSSTIWVHANDERITHVSERQVLQCSPYLLFYQRTLP